MAIKRAEDYSSIFSGLDVLRGSQYKNYALVMLFIKFWGKDINPAEDIHDRFYFGIPPKLNGDYAFIQHMIASLKDTGRVSTLTTFGIKSKSPCYLGGTDFYVRTNPASDKLEGPKLVRYVTHHFKANLH